VNKSITKTVLLVAIAFAFVGTAGAATDGDQNEAEGAIKQLWSANATERDAGKERLLSLKHDAIRPLLRLLEDLTFNERQRYPTGLQSMGAWIFERYQESLASGDKAKIRELHEHLSQIEISDRLENDVCELLGQLRSVAAVPGLIRLIGHRAAAAWGSGSWSHISSSATYAVSQIGSPAVPRVVEAIHFADDLAANKVARDTSGPKTKTLKGRANVIRVQLAAVLAEIGDAAALPALRMLTDGSDDSEVKSWAWEAIQRISIKNSYLSGADYLRIYCNRFGRLNIRL
jgi:hypothetical protein